MPMRGMPFATIRTWGEMIRISHSVFALPFALIATFMAGKHLEGGFPHVGQIGLIVLCMVAARSFAMTFNRIADAKIDAANPRTAGRPLPTGKISVGQAWCFLFVSVFVFGLGCLGFHLAYGNAWPLYLAAPTLLLLAAYSYAKRASSLAHFALGTAIGFAPVAGWIAIHPLSLGPPAFLLMAAVIFWIAGFDIIYACQDMEHDRREDLFSIPAGLGIPKALFVSRVCHVLTVGLLVALGIVSGLGWLFWVALAVTALLLAVEQAVVRPNDLSRVNLAFFTINGCISLMLGAATICDVLFIAE